MQTNIQGSLRNLSESLGIVLTMSSGKDVNEAAGCEKATAAVLVESVEMPKDVPACRGFDFNKGLDYEGMFKSFITHGFQATHFGLAVNQINQMLKWRLSDEKFDPNTEGEELKDPKVRAKIKCTIFLGFTSNMVSCGNREVLRYLLQHKLVNACVTTGGAIEEDIMKCFHPHYMGDFRLKGRDLREKGHNRIGNLIVPNKNYCAFEDWLKPILGEMLVEQQATVREITLTPKQADKIVLIDTKGGPVVDSEGEGIPCGATIFGLDGKIIACKKAAEVTKILKAAQKAVTVTVSIPGEVWTPAKIIRRMGKTINNPDSCLYWAYKNDIPIYCPAITDGAVGDVVFFHSYKEKGLVIDTAQDIKGINELAMNAPKTGMIILGGGVVKHHICNANLMRNGADYAVFVNTGQEFDGSDSGARPDEAISWGKIKVEAKPVKVYGDASLIWPLLVSQTFVREVESKKTIKIESKSST
ncbi:hypothetical protein AAMO2058_001216400 [Amorphochlora amoebiformis]